MDTTLLSLYLKLNLLLAATLLLWIATKGIARGLRFESSHAWQLNVARLLFTGFLLASAIALFAYGWLTAFATRLADGITVIAGIDVSLEKNYAVGAVGFDVQTLIVALLVAGFAWQAARLALQVCKLRDIVGQATEWRQLHGTCLLVSSQVNTPFSTRVLGKTHVVFPMTLLESPRNLRLAVKHELQHVRNGDLEWVILLEAVKVLCFWNPAAWLWHNEFDCLQEFACDEALVDTRHVTPQAYGTCLLEVASVNSGNALLAASNMVPRFSWLQDTQSQLKRRITMLTNARGKKHQTLKSLGYAMLAGLGMTQAALIVFAADTGSDAVLRPLVRINPEYPRQALAQGMVGWVNIRFNVAETGAVTDPVVIENCAWVQAEGEPDPCKPDDMFNDSALAALAKWRYEPKIENGVPVAREGIQTIIRFALEDPEGCLYASKLYPVGETISSESDDGVFEQTCIKDPENPGDYRWGEYKLDGRSVNLQ